MFKFALLAAIAAAADSEDAVATYSGDGLTVSDTDSNGIMTTPLSFEITTAKDSVTNKSSVGATLSSGDWGTTGTSTISVCIPIPSNTEKPFECRVTTNGAKVGTFIMFNATKILAAPADASDVICTLTW